MASIVECPSCRAQLQLSFASGPRKAASAQATVPIDLGDILTSIDITMIEEKEAEFVTEMRERFDKYGERIRVSEKQLAWLKKISERAF